MNFYCSVCGRKGCDVIGTVCETCRHKAKLQRPKGAHGYVLGTCFYCSREETFVTDDHVIPLARGGPHEPWNLRPACFVCNPNKSDLLPSEWCPSHKEAVMIEKLAITRGLAIFPRMRREKLLGGNHLIYSRIRNICKEFMLTILSESDGLTTSDKAKRMAIKAWKHADDLHRHVDDAIRQAGGDAKGGDWDDQGHRR
jgi:HNH endonuclease